MRDGTGAGPDDPGTTGGAAGASGTPEHALAAGDARYGVPLGAQERTVGAVIGFGTLLGAGAGLVLGTTVGTFVVPVVGTLFGAAYGLAIGLTAGLVEGLVLALARRWLRSRPALSAVAVVVAVLLLLAVDLPAVFTGTPVADRGVLGLVVVLAGVTAWVLAPLAVHGLRPRDRGFLLHAAIVLSAPVLTVPIATAIAAGGDGFGASEGAWAAALVVGGLVGSGGAAAALAVGRCRARRGTLVP